MQDLSGPPRGPATAPNHEERMAHGASAVRAALWLAGVCGLGVLIVTAWMSDDAYITLRTIDNVWHGFGLRWNAMERVQAYTHPLWLVLIAAAYGLTREAFLTTLALSFACTIGAASIVVTRIAPTTPRALVAVACLLGSKAFVEFSTSGLENPLSHLLLAWFCWDAWRDPSTTGAGAPGSASRWRVRRLSFIAALCALTRVDLLALIAPMLLHAIVRARRGADTGARVPSMAAHVGAVAVGLLPLVAWELFSLIYYGFAFPNTAYAKLATAIPRGELVAQGSFYLLDSLTHDPITLAVIVIAIVWSLARWRHDGIVGVSLVCALLYVVFVGGDFMSGRFLSPAFVVAVAWLCRTAAPLDRPARALVAAAAITVISAIAPRSPWRVWQMPAPGDPIVEHGHGIVDERSSYYAHTGLVPYLLGRGSPASHPWAAPAIARRGIPNVQVYEAVGLLGYYSGPAAHIVDPMALTDPLLARLPARRPWRIGHFTREIPEGYVATVERCVAIVFPRGRVAPPAEACVTSSDRLNAIRDPAAATLYDRLALITQAPLFDPRRLRAILDINLGR